MEIIIMFKSKSYFFYLAFILIALFVSCATQHVSTISGYDFDKDKNQTNYFIFPFGSVSIPDKWEKSSYNETSKQQFFKNSDSITIAIAFGSCNKFEFNSDNSKSGFEFIEAYYEWDSQYFITKHGLNSELKEIDSLNNFIIWRLRGLFNSKKVDHYFLFGEKNCFVSNFSVLTTNKWSENQKIDFLKRIYLNAKQE